MSKDEATKNVVKRKVIETPPKPKGKNYLLVIGIDDYEHCPKLFNAVKDAKSIVSVLHQKFQFDKKYTKTLYNKEATKRNIFKAFEDFAERITPDDNLIIYFSGHGEYKDVFNIGYWIPVEAERDAADQFIENSVIKNILSAIKSHHTFLMVDSCFSGVLFSGATREVALRKERDPSRWGLTAGRNEIVTDGESGSNSPFAKSILYQLENTNEPIGVADLCDTVLEVVAANAHQTPRGEPLQVTGHKGGQFVFHLKQDEMGDWKMTIENGSLSAYQMFIAKYPDGQFTSEAKTKIRQLEAEELWQKIELAKEQDLKSVQLKLGLINRFVDQYEKQPHYDEALNTGEVLEYKKDFLEAQSSEFALRRFLRKPVPKVAGCAIIQKEAQQLLQNWNNPIDDKPPIKEVPKPKVIPIKEDPPIVKILPKKEEKTIDYPIDNSKKEPDFLKKYGKYFIPLVLLPFLIWGIIKMLPDGSTITLVEDKLELFQDSNSTKWGYKLGESIIAIPAKYDYASEFFEGKAKVAIGNKTFVIDEKGNCIENCEENNNSLTNSSLAEEAEWSKAKDQNKAEIYKTFLEKYPESKYRRDAIVMIRRLKSAPEDEEILKDTDGNTYRWKKMRDGKKWMIQNLNTKTLQSWCNGCDQYGRLYTWAAAARACPTDWRLPTLKEWEQLVKNYSDRNDFRRGFGDKAFNSLAGRGAAGFFAQLAGLGKNGAFDGKDQYGIYWTRTAGDLGKAVTVYFDPGRKNITIVPQDKNVAFSCRCIEK